MVEITNNWIIVEDNDSYEVMNLKSNLSIIVKEKIYAHGGKDLGYTNKRLSVYVEKDGNLYIPRGLWFLVKDLLHEDVIDNQYRSKLSEDILFSIDEIRNSLDGITLTDEQVIAVRKILFAKRCLVQLPTGSGKSEVFCSVIKLLEKHIGNIPTTLILEPSSRLVVGTIERLRRYGIECIEYNNTRRILDNIVTVAHPKSLGNDLDKNQELLSNVSVLIGDESHHMSSKSFRKPTYNMDKLELSIGLSASAIDKNNVGGTKLSDFSYKELLIMGSTGKLVLNVNANHFINKGILAKAALIRMNNPANESLGNKPANNWHAIREIKLESERRIRLVAYVAKFFCDKGRKVLILVNTTSWANKIMSVLNEYGVSDLSRCSFGGNVFMRHDGENCVSTDEDVFGMYSRGEIKILIGTTHIYEGVDVPSLDTIILAYGGKGERMQVQGIGRALRRTKTGSYAYIIDFTDHEDIVLSKHSRLRMQRYKELIGIPDNLIFDYSNVGDLEGIFKSLED